MHDDLEQVFQDIKATITPPPIPKRARSPAEQALQLIDTYLAIVEYLDIPSTIKLGRVCRHCQYFNMQDSRMIKKLWMTPVPSRTDMANQASDRGPKSEVSAIFNPALQSMPWTGEITDLFMKRCAAIVVEKIERWAPGHTTNWRLSMKIIVKRKTVSAFERSEIHMHTSAVSCQELAPIGYQPRFRVPSIGSWTRQYVASGQYGIRWVLCVEDDEGRKAVMYVRDVRKGTTVGFLLHNILLQMDNLRHDDLYYNLCLDEEMADYFLWPRPKERLPYMTLR